MTGFAAPHNFQILMRRLGGGSTWGNRRSLFLLVVTLLLCGCCHPVLTAEQAGFYYLRLHTFATADSLQLVASLSDTVVAANSLGTMTDSGWIALDSVKKNSLVLKCCIASRFDRVVELPLGQSTVIPCDIGLCSQGFGYRLGAVDGEFNELDQATLSPDMEYREENYFRPVRAGETWCKEQPIAPLDWIYLTEMKPGRYWVQVVFHSSIWHDGSAPVWLGQLQSDTLYFRVVP